MKKFLLKLLGLVSVVLGTIGIFLPVIPTTPFLLLAAWSFLNSSDSLYNWLMNHRVLGLYIRSYVEYKGVSKSHKIFAITTLWLTMFLSIYLINKAFVKILLIIIGILVTLHLLKLRTLTKSEMEELDRMRSRGKGELSEQM
ncbi:MAG: YbaN family protein [Peptoniphilus sp.]|nr:YbaN family protein [Peptoniphilus sp.]